MRAMLAAVLFVTALGGLVRITPDDAEPAAGAAKTAADAADEALAENAAIVPEAKGAASEAKTAAKAAADAATEAEGLVTSTQTEADKAAEAAAKATFEEVQKFATKALNGDAADRAEKEKKSEENAAIAAASAAEPYNAAMMRAQKLAHDYQTKAQELATAGNVLKQQAITLAGSAEHFQYTGNTIQANQIMVQAHSLFASADNDQAEANKLKSTADEVVAMIPSYSLAAQAAAAAAEAENAPVAEEPPAPYFLQIREA